MVVEEALFLIQQYGIIGVFLSSLLFNLSVLFPLPADLVVFTAGSLSNGSLFFNPLAIGISAGIAAAVGELAAWAIGWGMERHVLRQKVGEKYDEAMVWFEKYGFFGIIAFAFLPLPMDVMGLLAGTLRYDGKKFFYAAVLGKIPRFVLLAYGGHYGLQFVHQFYLWVF